MPRLNAHHKQFFFASRPIFVEGPTDQQIFTLIQEKRGKPLGASGMCFIDAGGKEELDLFFRICKELEIDAQFVVDLDVLTEGKLRQSVSEDSRCKTYSQEEGLGQPKEVIGNLEKEIDKCPKELKLESCDTSLQNLLKNFQDAHCQNQELKKQRYIFLLGLKNIFDIFVDIVPSNMGNLPSIKGRFQKIIQAFKYSGVHILSRGELENYCPAYTGNPFNIPDGAKARVFEQERDFLLRDNLTEEEIHKHYGELIDILDEVTYLRGIDIREYLANYISEFIFSVQYSYKQYHIKDADSLKKNANVRWQTCSRIFDLLEFSPKERENGFVCKIKIKPSVYQKERPLEFDEKTHPVDDVSKFL